jgi:hypothetical protein
VAVRTGRQHPRDVRSAAVALCGGRWLITVADGRWPAFIHSLHSRKPEGPGSEEGKCKGPWCVWRCVLLRR